MEKYDPGLDVFILFWEWFTWFHLLMKLKVKTKRFQIVLLVSVNGFGLYILVVLKTWWREIGQINLCEIDAVTQDKLALTVSQKKHNPKLLIDSKRRQDYRKSRRQFKKWHITLRGLCAISWPLIVIFTQIRQMIHNMFINELARIV